TRPGPKASMTTIVSTADPFNPPKASGKGRASTPSSANWRQMSRLNPSGERARARRFSKPYSFAMKRRSVSWSAVCSSVKLKSMAFSQSQDHLGNNIFLDLVRAAVNGGLAQIEVMRRRRHRVFRPDRRFLGAGLHGAILIRKRAVSDRLQGQLRQQLLNFRAFDFQDRGFRPGRAFFPLGGDH